MITIGLSIRLEAKPGKESELKEFLATAAAMAQDETTTPVWLAIQFGPTTFGIIDAFADGAGMQAHSAGAIAAALGSKAGDLLAAAPAVERFDVVGAKLAP